MSGRAKTLDPTYSLADVAHRRSDALGLHENPHLTRQCGSGAALTFGLACCFEILQCVVPQRVKPGTQFGEPGFINLIDGPGACALFADQSRAFQMSKSWDTAGRDIGMRIAISPTDFASAARWFSTCRRVGSASAVTIYS
jgi:hypothetical protein